MIALSVVLACGALAGPATSGAGPVRAVAPWMEAAGIDHLPDFMREQAALGLDWREVLGGPFDRGLGRPSDRASGDDQTVLREPDPSVPPSAEPPVDPSAEPLVDPSAPPSGIPATHPAPTLEPTVPATPSPIASPELTDEPAPEPVPTVTVPGPVPAPEPAPEPAPSLTPAPTAGPAPTATPEPAPAPTTEPSAEPTTAPDPGPDPVVPVPAPTAAPDADPPLLIKHGWDIPSPRFVQANVASMEQQPFDGLAIAMPGLSNQVQRQTPISYEQFRDVLAPVAATQFTTLKHNFVMVYATPGGDYFGDWSVPVSNFANLARAAREAGFAGVVYDNEEYFGRSVDYPAGCASHTLTECQDQVRLRGEQVMDAMRAQWPDIEMLTLFGAWVSEPQTYRTLSPVLQYNDISWANELMGPFVVGLTASTVGTEAKIIDGGEIYTARTPSQFAAVNDWQNEGMAARSGLVPDELRPVWADTVSAAFGVYDRPWIGAPMDVGLWESTVANALEATDEYVWLYTEEHDWWGSGWPATPVPSEWVDATRAARLTAG